MAGFSAFLDANVLYSAIIRDVSLQFALWDFYEPRWSNHVLGEVSKNLYKASDAFGRTFDRHTGYMAAAFADSQVENFDYVQLGADVAIDKKDAHVLRAAIHAQSGAIVTFNTKDFPSDLFERFGIELIHPDEFYLDLFELQPSLAMAAMSSLLGSYENPRLTLGTFADLIERAQCPRFAAVIRFNLN